MHKLTVLYGHPKDPEAFERYYAQTHMSIADKMPGIARVELSKGLPGPDGAEPPYYRMAELWFDNAAAMQHCMASPEGRAAVADLANFATGGVTVLVSEVVD